MINRENVFSGNLSTERNVTGKEESGAFLRWRKRLAAGALGVVIGAGSVLGMNQLSQDGLAPEEGVIADLYARGWVEVPAEQEWPMTGGLRAVDDSDGLFLDANGLDIDAGWKTNDGVKEEIEAVRRNASAHPGSDLNDPATMANIVSSPQNEVGNYKWYEVCVDALYPSQASLAATGDDLGRIRHDRGLLNNRLTDYYTTSDEALRGRLEQLMGRTCTRIVADELVRDEE